MAENKKPKLLGYRKFIITAIILVLAAVLVIWDKISGETFMTLVVANSGVYAASNVAAKLSNGNKVD